MCQKLAPNIGIEISTPLCLCVGAYERERHRYILLPVVSSSYLCTLPAPADSVQAGVSIITHRNKQITLLLVYSVCFLIDEGTRDTSANTLLLNTASKLHHLSLIV